MISVHNSTIQRKLMWIMALATSTALLITGIAIVLYELLTFEQRFATRFTGQAAIIATNSRAALLFYDQSKATEILQAFQAENDVIQAVLYDAKGQEFAAYRQGQAIISITPPPLSREKNYYFANQHYHFYTPITLEQDLIGGLYIEASSTELYRRLWNYGGIVTGVLLLSLFTALLLSAQLQRLISAPILKLAVAMKQVSQQRDYQIRVHKEGHDEIGILIDGFNHMLTQISRQNESLRQHGNQLEEQIAYRTDELLVTNANLQRTVEALQQARDGLYQEKEKAQITLDSIGDAVITTNAGGQVEYMNLVAERLAGWTESEAQGKAFAEVFDLISDATSESVPSLVERCLRENQTIRLDQPSLLMSRDGQEYTIESSAAPIRKADGAILGSVAILRDVSVARRLHKQILFQATHDALTGLVNRYEFERQLNQLLVDAKTEQHSHGLCYLDLDQFKVVNDTAGHPAGDELLRQIGKLLRAQLRDSDTLARLGGDEFGILMRYCTLDNAVKIANGLLQAIQNYRFSWEQKTFAIGASIGVVLIDSDTSDDHATLFSIADSALYAAKEAGRNRIHAYQPDDELLAQRRGEMQWLNVLHEALDHDRFELHQQPIEALQTLSDTPPLLYELLVRMLDQQGQLIYPGAFIPAAERYQQMVAIDRWVVRHAFKWLQAHPQELQSLHLCTINLSGLSLSDQSFAQFLLNELNTTAIPGRKICFEITETAAVRNLGTALEFLNTVKKYGCSLALDDFGSGLSSFGFLKQWPVDFLKIDKGFVAKVMASSADLAVVESMTKVGHIMGMQVIAEGVEDRAALDRLKEIGVDFVQGYAIAKPKPLRKRS